MFFTPFTSQAKTFVLGGIALTCLLSGCASPKPSRAIEKILERDVGKIDDGVATRIMQEHIRYSSKARTKVEGEIQRKVWWWIRYYTVIDRERFKRNFSRGERYRHLIQQILTERRLPPELYYLAMVESGYVTHATSSTAAVGIWQFMRPTALHYKLNVDGAYDERRHPIAATQAATQYLTDLHEQFDSWYLAIAAYNAGQGRIRKAIKKGKTRNFWELAERGHIPHETMDYIPKFLAAASIGAHLEEFGFSDLEDRTPLVWPKVSPIQVKPGTKLSKIAKMARLSEKELVRLNPQLPEALNSSGRKPFRIWVTNEAI